MGIENRRRWPVYIIFAFSVILMFSLFNSWGDETELHDRILDMGKQLQECSQQRTSCMEESITSLARQDSLMSEIDALKKANANLNDAMTEVQISQANTQTLLNTTIQHHNFCKTELQSLKNLEASKTAMLDTLRIEKESLISQLDEFKNKALMLEKEVERLKISLSTKPATVPLPVKITPAVELPKISPSFHNKPVNQQIFDNNDAKEELEDTGIENDLNHNVH